MNISASPQYLLTDSRQIAFPDQSVFFAIKGQHHNGHRFLADVYEKGVRNFVVETGALTPDIRNWISAHPEGKFTEVNSSLTELQRLAAEHRSRFSIPVVGITGSNGKTILKEWLLQLLSPFERIVANPKSYNSQLGVPLSVWQIQPEHTFGIFEAGISQPHEMPNLQKIIQPSIGIFTNIGSAHDAGFSSRKQKVTEKLKLFTKSRKLIFCADYHDVSEEISTILVQVNPSLELISWSEKEDSVVKISYRHHPDKTEISVSGKYGSAVFSTPFTDKASLENLTHCLVFLLDYGLQVGEIQSRINLLRPVSMRLELKEAINRSYLIDDSYSNDLQSLTVALNFLQNQHQRNRKIVILSDVLQSGRKEEELYSDIAELLREKEISALFAIGKGISMHEELFSEIPETRFYPTTDDFLAQLPLGTLTDSIILVKGARTYSFERIVRKLQRLVHGTVLEINLDALTHNLNFYRNQVGSSTRIMVMVKAFAYGSGSTEVANLLQFHRVDYLAVAYPDEGVALRQSGITLPIMVMNPSESSFETLVEYRLEPELYSRNILNSWIQFGSGVADRRELPSVHLKLDTGMHRLGFVEADLSWLQEILPANPWLKVASTFTHLVGADEGKHNEFSRLQYQRFKNGSTQIEQMLGYPVIKHILNTSGIVRFPEYKMDMVRLGIGLYGVDPTRQKSGELLPVSSLKTTISQIKTLPPDESVGYSRKGITHRTSRIGTIALGYADGYDRGFGNGIGSVFINGTLCPTIGNICMDMTMVDLTDAKAEEGDEVIVFGKEVPINDLAHQIHTIPYEILTGIGDRVKRVFYKE